MLWAHLCFSDTQRRTERRYRPVQYKRAAAVLEALPWKVERMDQVVGMDVRGGGGRRTRGLAARLTWVARNGSATGNRGTNAEADWRVPANGDLPPIS